MSANPDPVFHAPSLGGLAHAIGSIATIMEHQREHIRLLEAVVDNFPGGISLFDKDLNMVLCNMRQRQMLDYPDELMANGYPSMEDLFRFNAERGEYGPGEVESIVARKMQLARKREPHVFERTRPNGAILEVRGMPIAGGGFVTIYLDVTEQRRAQAMIAHMAHHDALTKLPNRVLFRDRLEQAVALAGRGAVMALHYLDVDGFKPVNDRLGHKAGDELLVAIAERLLGTVRKHDTVARLGGDEFAIVQTGIRESRDAVSLATRVMKAIAAPFPVAGEAVSIGISIGIAIAPSDGLEPEDLLRKADAAMYASKGSGRSRISFFQAARAA
ncbi:MAG: diguanylate cyclase [Mesorhizobium sp.]|nr:diguanylate cyclase [Mesorhizobium sp.]MCO5161235.1 diguanylate cyclase [Mesorhizobium sp.]